MGQNELQTGLGTRGNVKAIQNSQIVICGLQNALSLCFDCIEMLLPFFGQVFDGLLGKDHVFPWRFWFFHVASPFVSVGLPPSVPPASLVADLVACG
ncbi:hypothetical protein [Xanthobacter flavus]|uniref:hypothetical protein n=1 Tax=Xanthobacter flavus TaxID=281 RepID=UPI0037264DBB